MSAQPIFEVYDLRNHDRGFNEARVRARCRGSYVGEATSLCLVLGRYKMLVDTQDIGVSSHLMLDGFWEMWVTKAILPCVRGGTTVVDVGAGLGYYSLVLADLAGAAGRMIAFEPNALLAGKARSSLLLNGFSDFSTVHECALGSAAGVGTLHWDRRRPAGGRIEDWNEGEEQVPIRRLDSFPEAIGAEFVRIDVQGHEQRVWRGMTGVLANGQPLTIFMRFHADRYPDPRGFLDEILGEGFALEIVDPDLGAVPTSAAEIMARPANLGHMLCLRR